MASGRASSENCARKCPTFYGGTSGPSDRGLSRIDGVLLKCCIMSLS